MNVEQDARYAPAYFPPSIESGNRKFTSSFVKRILLRIKRQYSDIADIFRTSASSVENHN